jgi:hypothetical protein
MKYFFKCKTYLQEISRPLLKMMNAVAVKEDSFLLTDMMSENKIPTGYDTKLHLNQYQTILLY